MKNSKKKIRFRHQWKKIRFRHRRKIRFPLLEKSYFGAREISDFDTQEGSDFATAENQISPPPYTLHPKNPRCSKNNQNERFIDWYEEKSEASAYKNQQNHDKTSKSTLVSSFFVKIKNEKCRVTLANPFICVEKNRVTLGKRRVTAKKSRVTAVSLW